MPTPRRFRRAPFPAVRLCGLALAGLWVGAALAAGQDRDEDTLQGLLEKGLRSFEAGDYAGAISAFDRLESDFGEEPEYRAEAVQRVVLPVRGYAQLAGGDAAGAAATFERFLEAFPEDVQRRALILFSLAKAYQGAGDAARAIDAYARFEKEFPRRPEAALAALRRAELHFGQGERGAGMAVLDGFYRSGAPAALRLQARLRAVQHNLDGGETEAAAELLLDTAWSVRRMPELAVLAFAALRIGDHLLAAGRAADAVRAYRLVPPSARLVAAQRERLVHLEAAHAKRLAQGRPGSSVWREHTEKMIARIKAQLKGLEAAEDYTPGFYLRQGQALLLAGRGEEAWIVFETLALDAEVPETTRTQAHYRWIVAANALAAWDDALVIAREFIRIYPKSELAAPAIFLIATAHQEQREFAKAAEVLTELIEGYPDHPHLARWLFTRGFCRLLDGRNPAARDDFARYARDFAGAPLAVNARTWHAIARFFEKDYPAALEEFDALLASVPAHALVPEIHYRRASTLYAMRDYARALPAIERFLADYSGHQRAPEATVLKGDILMGKGDMAGASAAFARVTPEAGHLFPYAVFQTGKIFKALEYYERLIEYFTEYVERDDLGSKPRVSEALYWIGWAQNQLGRPAEAFPVFVDALEATGDDPAEGEVGLILQELHKLHRRYRKTGRFAAATPEGAAASGASGAKGGGAKAAASNSSNSPRAAAILAADDFLDWAEDERQAARAAGRLTYFTRLNLHLSTVAARSGDETRADTLLLEVANHVPLEQLGPEALGRVGMNLLEDGIGTARSYLEQLLERFPASPHRALALYGMARLAVGRWAGEEAEQLLRRFAAEVPQHPVAPRANLLLGEVLVEAGRAAEAIPVLEDLLRRKSARGRPHAEALRGLARAHLALEQPDKAIAYYQRIFTLYRAERDLVAEAYAASAQLFEERGDIAIAHATLVEMGENADLLGDGRFSAALARAREEAHRMAALLPKEAPAGTATGAETPPAREAGGTGVEPRGSP